MGSNKSVILPSFYTPMKILSLTFDEELAKLRHFVLTQASHEVTTLATEKDVASASKKDLPYDVALICHHVPASMARPLVRLARDRNPGIRFVYISRLYGEWPEVEADRYVVGADGPEALLRLLDEMGSQ